MTIPVLKCKNLTTGEVCTIPAEEGYKAQVFDFMTSLLQEPVGKYRLNNLEFYVHETDSFKYCAALDEIKSDEQGKTRTIKYTRDDVIQFCSSIERFAEENFNEIINYAHDIQYMIGTFVHESIVNANNENNIDALRAALIRINSLSAIISAKDSFFRWKTGTFTESKISIDVKGKYFKIVKAFQRSGPAKKKHLKISFTASKDIPNIDTIELFDFIPYLLIENAVKYSPPNSEIDVEVKRIKGSILAVVGSYGPTLLEGENLLIFEKNYRGKNALKSGLKGQGLGLYHLKEALSDFQLGTISVAQQGETMINGCSQSYTEFEIRIPNDA